MTLVRGKLRLENNVSMLKKSIHLDGLCTPMKCLPYFPVILLPPVFRWSFPTVSLMALAAAVEAAAAAALAAAVEGAAAVSALY